MDCSYKKKVSYTSQSSGVENSMEEVSRNILMKDELIANVKNVSDSIFNDNFSEISKERTKIAKTLDKIKDLDEYGFIINSSNSEISNSSSLFFDRLLLDKSQAEDLIKRSGRDMTVEESNKYLNKIISSTFDYDKTYMTEEGISNEFLQDYNDMLYQKYLENVGLITTSALEGDKDVDPEFRDQIFLMKNRPIVAHLNASIHAITSKKNKAKISGNIDPVEEANLDIMLADLRERKETISERITEELMFEHLDKILEDIQHAKDQSTPLTTEVIDIYNKSLDLVIQSREMDPEKNLLLDVSEIYDEDLMDAIRLRAGKADTLKTWLQRKTMDTVIKDAKMFTGVDFEDALAHKVLNLKNWYSRAASQVLSIAHIANPIVQYLHNLVTTSDIEASHKARTSNDAIEKAYKKMNSEDPSKKDLFYQNTAEGFSTGFITDVFSQKYWQMKKSLKSPKKRSIYMLELNPEVLSRPEGDKERDALHKEVIDSMGEYMGQKHIAEALRLWGQYNVALDSFKASNPTAVELVAWENKFSPIKRIQNYNIGSKGEAGSDTYLISIPKRFSTNGKDLGMYDENYKKIMASPSASEFYKLTREAFTSNQIALGNYSRKFSPPPLAYIGKTVSELIGKGDYEGAIDLAKKNAKKSLNFTEEFNPKNYSKDPITGQYGSKLSLEVHSIPEEVRNRVSYNLKDNLEYKTLVASTKLDDLKKASVIYNKERLKVSTEVNKERSQDLLQSVVMANYATHKFVQKKAIEIEVGLATRMVKEGLIKVPTDKKDPYNKSAIHLLDSVQHFVDVSFYEKQNLDITAPLTTDSEKKTTAVTTRKVASGAREFGRIVALGWSVPNALLNFGQQFFSNVYKALENDDFNFKDMLYGYRDIFTKSKDRNLVDKLFIVGDVAYGYSERSIYESNKIVEKLKPMYVTTFIEKINQGSTSLAVMRNIKLKDKNGKEISLYDALDSNGNLSKEYTHDKFKGVKGIELLSRLTSTIIRPAVIKTAGDYVNPLLVERTETGKLMLMFRKFLPEMMADRFGKTFNYTTNEYERGRMRAALKVLVKASVRMRTGEDMNISEGDLRRAKAGVGEIIVGLAFKALVMTLARGLCDTPGCKEDRGYALFQANMMLRLSDDVLTFIDPGSLTQSITTPFAIEGTVKDIFGLMDDITSYVIPGGDTGIYKTGGHLYEKGDLKALTHARRLLPFYRSNIYKVKDMSNKLKTTATLSGLISDEED